MRGPFYVYNMANVSRTLYVGVTNDIQRRVCEHKAKATPSFTERYNVTRLVHVEEYDSIVAAIEREKRIKGWDRARRVALIEQDNPTWRDLATG